MFDKILLLDDNKATNFIHTKFIQQANAAKEVVTFLTGQSALDYLNNTDEVFPNLVISDINMPTMDVWEFLDAYRQINRPEKQQARIILLTTSLSQNDKDLLEKYEMVDYILAKPMDKKAVEGLVDKYLR
ncbi:response regulator [Croceivirga sp. JEA036]|uniref:response regulator n=1 Tax=Croceivirga sp. JEA036 TaxID=2721162 RepID=UPI00143BF63C|nr:response regulator [Croceivirga sp. JEA036]NJB37034.1 response regulator [Croceivirga sp. JEA036]